MYAKPITFESQTLLSSTKGFAAIFLFIIGIINSWIIGNCVDDTSSNVGCTDNNNDGNVPQSKNLNSAPPKQSTSVTSLFDKQCDANQENNGDCEDVERRVLQRKRIIYTLLFAFVSTSRASSNIASANYTYSYNISKLQLLCMCSCLLARIYTSLSSLTTYTSETPFDI